MLYFTDEGGCIVTVKRLKYCETWARVYQRITNCVIICRVRKCPRCRRQTEAANVYIRRLIEMHTVTLLVFLGGQELIVRQLKMEMLERNL